MTIQVWTIDDRDARIASLTEAVRVLTEALTDTAASLSATHSLLSRGGRKAAPSDKMFAVMLEDYRKSLDHAVAALTTAKELTK